MFASGIGAESKYAATHEGFELEQTLTPYVRLVGRISGYQIYQGDGWDWPLSGHGSRPRNFGVMLGGLDLLPFQGTSLKILGGGDVGDSDHAAHRGRLLELAMAAQPPSDQPRTHRANISTTMDSAAARSISGRSVSSSRDGDLAAWRRRTNVGRRPRDSCHEGIRPRLRHGAARLEDQPRLSGRIRKHRRLRHSSPSRIISDGTSSSDALMCRR